MNPDDVRIGRNLVELRARMGLNQTAIARAMKAAGVDWHQNTVSRVEGGHQPLSVSDARSLIGIVGPGLLAGIDLGGDVAAHVTKAQLAHALKLLRDAVDAMPGAA